MTIVRLTANGTPMIGDFIASGKRFRELATIALMRFVLDYRASRLGTLWVFLQPLTFIAFLSFIYSHVNGLAYVHYLLYLTVGLVTWNFINTFVADAPALFIKNRPFLLQGELSITDIILQQSVRATVIFAYQFILVVVAILLNHASLDWIGLMSALALPVIVLNGLFLLVIVGIIGARYRDGAQAAPAAMRIVFLATPILWVADAFSARSALLKAYIQFNPFYHYIEIVRRPLVNHEVPVQSWAVVGALTCVFFALASVVYRRYSKVVTLWL